MILGVDTSTKTLGLALAHKGKILGKACIDTNARHSEIFMEELDALLKKAKVKPAGLSKIACSTGPGTFTGIRVGLTVCRAFSQVLRIPLVGVTTLDLLYEGVKPALDGSGRLVCPIIANQQEEVYTSLYKGKRISPYISVNINTLADDLLKKYGNTSNGIVFVGDAVPLYKKIVEAKLKDKAIFLKDIFSMPSAAVLALMAEKMKGERYDRVKPVYVKAPRISVGINPLHKNAGRVEGRR